MMSAQTHSPRLDWLRRAIFPGTVVLTQAAAIWGIHRGMSLTGLLLALSAFAAVVTIAGERVIPFEPVWNRPRKDIGVDAIHTAVSQGLVPELGKIAAFPLLAGLGSWFSARTGAQLWPAHWPLAAQLALAAVVGEFGQYWFHRWAHEKDGILWRLHSTHHSPRRLYWLNAGRDHPLSALVFYWISVLPLFVMGIPAEPLMLWALLTAVHGLFQHANVDVRLGPLNWVFSMAELHRWHHSLDLREANTNYGANLILWDVVFGTRFLPRDRRPPVDIGIGGMPNFPQTYLEQLRVPFRWRRLVAEGVELQAVRSE